MKIEIDDSQLINDIVEKVVERLKPLLNNSHDSKHNELMTVDEVVKYLKAKKSTIYDKVHSKSIPFLKNGNSLRFRRKHIDIWLRNPYSPELETYNLNFNGRKGVRKS
jgi:excisionase family DNA binding protein